MKYQTIAAAFDTRAHAKAAVDALKAAGFHPDDISLLDKQVVPEAAGWTGKGPSLWQRIFGTEVKQHEAAVYNQAVEFGGAVLSVRVPEYEVAHATGILDLHHPIDVKDRALTAGLVPAAHVESAIAALPVAPLPVKQEIAVPLKLTEKNEQILNLADEQLKVGKRMIETGKTRVRRFVTERDVSADVTLHEEHAEVLRRAVTDPKFLADVDWADKSIEVTETAEQALVSKTAKVVEEIALKKIGSDHVQTLHDKVRRQEVEIEHLGPDGKKMIEEKVNAPELVGASVK
ncbi:MAG TPA: YsnF/AvaK domain-containing protein [Gemmatimonadaceae bacterium]|nr:YsnF/AvaK domain-containing protein [Gemmatimonadaceae bacterium]